MGNHRSFIDDGNLRVFLSRRRDMVIGVGMVRHPVGGDFLMDMVQPCQIGQGVGDVS